MVTYRGCFRWSLVALVAAAGLLAGGGAAGVILPTGGGAALIALTWLALTVRVIRLDPVGPGPGGGSGPGGAGMREPRRPKHGPPSGAIALPVPEDPPHGAAALA